MSYDETKMIEKIKMLLAKAEGTPYPEEAKTFQEHAERLMVRHGIEMAKIDAVKGKGEKEEVIFRTVDLSSASWQLAWISGLAAAVAAYGTCTTLQGSAWGGGKILYIVGAKSDVDAMIDVVQSLKLQSLIALKVWWKTAPERQWTRGDGNEAWKVRREFVQAFGFGAASRVREMVKDATASEAGTDLVLANRQAVAKAAVPTLFGKVGAARGGMSGSDLGGGARAAGRKAGREAAVGVGR